MTPSSLPPRRSRRRLAVLATSAVLVLAACGEDESSTTADDSSSSSPSAADESSSPDPTPSASGSTEPTDTATSESGPAAALWVTASGSGVVYRVDLDTREVRTVEVGHNLYDVEYADGSVWLAGAADSLHRLDVATDEVEELVEGGVREVATDGDQVWIAQAEGITAVDAASGTVGGPADVADVTDVGGLVVDAGVLWAWTDFGSELTRIDTATGDTTSGFVASGLGAVVPAGDVIWVAGEDELEAVDPTSLEGDDAADLPARAGAVALDPATGLLVLGYDGGSVATYDPATGTLSDPVSVAGDDISAVVVVDEMAWVGAEDGTFVALDPATLAVQETVELTDAANRIAIAVER